MGELRAQRAVHWMMAHEASLEELKFGASGAPLPEPFGCSPSLATLTATPGPGNPAFSPSTFCSLLNSPDLSQARARARSQPTTPLCARATATG